MHATVQPTIVLYSTQNRFIRPQNRKAFAFVERVSLKYQRISQHVSQQQVLTESTSTDSSLRTCRTTRQFLGSCHVRRMAGPWVRQVRGELWELRDAHRI